jgi:transporter family-2 protein
MIIHILLALLNGMVVGTSRAINGRLSIEIGAFRASVWNHVIGFVFLTLLLVVIRGWQFEAAAQLPWFVFLGGLFGALFVAVNSYVFPRIGAMNSSVLVISGQMLSAVLIDAKSRGVRPTWAQTLGVVIILVGTYLSKTSGSRPNKQRAKSDGRTPK